MTSVSSKKVDGLFTFADSAQEAYEHHIELVKKAEEYIRRETSVEFADDAGEIKSTTLGSCSERLRELAGRIGEVSGKA